MLQESSSNTNQPIRFSERSSNKVLIEHNTTLEIKSIYPEVRLSGNSQTLECLVSIKSDSQ
jgi:hypothetical protein